jgi:hypothetical protein
MSDIFDRVVFVAIKNNCRITFNANGIAAIQAEDDVDLLIVQTTVTKSDNKEVVVFGEDTDLLALLQIPPSVSMIKHSGRTQSLNSCNSIGIKCIFKKSDKTLFVSLVY